MPPSVKTKIRRAVCEWYDLVTMPMVIQTREEELEAFEAENDYIPPELWRFVNHPARLLFRWLRDPCCVDLVVRDGDSYRMIQDVCFKDAYPTEEAWKSAMLEILKDSAREVWVVIHEGDHPLWTTPS